MNPSAKGRQRDNLNPLSMLFGDNRHRAAAGVECVESRLTPSITSCRSVFVSVSRAIGKIAVTCVPGGLDAMCSVPPN